MKLRYPGCTISFLLAALLIAPPVLADQGGKKSGPKGQDMRQQQEKMQGDAEGKLQRERTEEHTDKSRGEEMGERRDERKQIMEEAKGAAEPGTPRAGKKPWWRFWDSDDE